MSNLKKRVSLILSIIMVALAIFPLTLTNAASQVTMTVSMNGQTLSPNGTYKVSGGEKITVKASSTGTEVERIGYYYKYSDGTTAEIIDEYKDNITITVPTRSGNETVKLYIEAIAKDNTKTGWVLFNLQYGSTTNVTGEVNMTVSMNGNVLAPNSTSKVSGGEKITVKASSTGTEVERIGYYYKYGDGTTAKIIDEYKNDITITVPTRSGNETVKLYIEAIAKDNTKTGWVLFNLQYGTTNVAGEVNMTVSMNGNVLAPNSTSKVSGGEKINAKAVYSNLSTEIERIGYYYKYGDGTKTETIDEYKDDITITVPTRSGNETVKLYIEAIAKDNTKTGWVLFNLQYGTTNVAGEVNMTVSMNGNVLAPNSTSKVSGGEKINAKAVYSNSSTEIERIGYYYKYGDGTKTEIIDEYKDDITITVPTRSGNETVKLYIEAIAKDNKKTGWVLFNLQYNNAGTVVDDNDELDVLPWEDENEDVNSLSVALRNDSDSKKENKNLYALDEEVTYYVDFKNGGKDIADEVVLKLELPMKFTVIDADGGAVDKTAGTITWNYINGMTEGYEGTKTVRVKYTGFDKKSIDYKKVYPLATITKGTKTVDESSVINFIYTDEDTVIDDTHVPYMYGDRDTPTFRPNDTITRAEGALVLTRILLGQRAIDNVTVTNVYPDLNETYLEAQKAIIAATSYGIINGYTDGYFRPNTPMTRAEFMKILAKFIEINAEDEKIKGLQIKNVDESVKLYRDLQERYLVNGTTLTTHWAIEEVTLLTRLNMTSASKNKDLRLDENITRAEVAQLVNFFLLRAPAEVKNSTPIKFTDVSRYHELVGDIIEATQPAHNYTITSDGTELAED